jgi:hypothetical protein
MEVERVRRLIIRWKRHNIADAKVSGYVPDRDAKVRKFVADLWGKPEILDRNHVTKSFERSLPRNPVLTGIRAKLRDSSYSIRLEEGRLCSKKSPC